MFECDPLLATMFKGLVKQAGGIEAARAAIEAVVGHTVSKSTVSQVQNGKAEVPWLWVSALEDATGTKPFHRLRTQQIEEEGCSEASLISHLKIVKESAEAALASAAAEGTNCPKKISESIKELNDLIDVAQQRADHDQARLDRMGLEVSE